MISPLLIIKIFVLLALPPAYGKDIIITLRTVQSFDRLEKFIDTQYVGDFFIDDISHTFTIATPSTLHFCMLFTSIDYDHRVLFAGNAGLCVIASYPEGPIGLARQQKVSQGTLHLGHLSNARKGIVFTSQMSNRRDLYLNITSHRDSAMIYLPAEIGSQGEWMVHMDGYSVGPETHVVRSYNAVFTLSTHWITGPMEDIVHIASRLGAKPTDETGYFKVKCSASLPDVAFRLGERSMHFSDIDLAHHTIVRIGTECVLPIRYRNVWDQDMWELGTSFMHGKNTSFWSFDQLGKYEIGLTSNHYIDRF